HAGRVTRSRPERQVAARGGDCRRGHEQCRPESRSTAGRRRRQLRDPQEPQRGCGVHRRTVCRKSTRGRAGGFLRGPAARLDAVSEAEGAEMTEPHHALATEIARLNAMERHIIDRFIHRQRVARDITEPPMRFGDRLADRVAAFGGSWAFILIAVAAICVWMLINVTLSKDAFDPYPYILLNLVLSCTAALQAPIIMMSQNRQAL